MTRPVCATCRITMRPIRNSVWWLEMGAWIVGTADGHSPYRLSQGDLWGCLNCDATVLTGFGKPVERHDPQFEPLVTAAIKLDEPQGYLFRENWQLSQGIEKKKPA